MTPVCQGASGGAMAVEATVGESQLQRIIRDLHGTSAFQLSMCAPVCVRVNRLAAGCSWLTWCDCREERVVRERFSIMLV